MDRSTGGQATSGTSAQRGLDVLTKQPIPIVWEDVDLEDEFRGLCASA